ncbi:MAG: J domain-containing protein [Rhodocyclaceae bacterium]|nr:J domain-containing protein [Rhodocyclaceae bacterium]
MPRAPQHESLFGEPQERNLTVVDALAQTKPQDKQQATFQRLIKQIHEQRVQIEEWQTYRERYNRRVAEKLMPLYAAIRGKRIAMALLLDAQYHRKDAIRGKRLRGKLQSMIVDLTRDLLLEERDEDIVALHDRHSDLTYDEDKELDKAFSQDIVENIFGVRLDDGDDGDSIEAMILKAQRKLAQEEAGRTAQRPPRRKSAKAAAAEEKRAAAEKAVSQSVREVYRKLASALHPDRAGGDLTAERKTELMQRVNRAYDNGNLLELLNIQLEIEQIDAAHLANLSAERVAHFNQVLREQVAELKAELEMLLAPYRILVPFNLKPKPIHVDMAMDGEIVRQKNDLRQLKTDLITFEDIRQLALALKDYQPADGLDGLDEFADLGALMDSFGAPPTRSHRRKR